jgi:hypothetical protein
MPLNFQTQQDYANKCKLYLFVFLAEHKPFMLRLEYVKTKYPDVSTEALETIDDLRCGPHPEAVQAREYYEELVQIIDEFGLNPDWALETIHEAVNNRFILYAGFNDTDLDENEYKINWNPISFFIKKQAKEHVLKQFETQWQEWENKLKEAGFKKTYTKTQFKKHMVWVFKRVVLKRSWSYIAKEGPYDISTVREPVEYIINLLGLKSPYLPPGHPPKKPSQ